MTANAKKGVHRPLQARLDEARTNLERIRRLRDAARKKYDRLHARYLRREQADRVAAIKGRFRAGEPLSEEEMEILRTVI